jgi:hypothetical protein
VHAGVPRALTSWDIGWPVAILYHLPPLTATTVRSVIAAARCSRD